MSPHPSYASREYLTPLATASFDRGDVSFIIVAGAMVFLMIPGLGTFLVFGNIA